MFRFALLFGAGFIIIFFVLHQKQEIPKISDTGTFERGVETQSPSTVVVASSTKVQSETLAPAIEESPTKVQESTHINREQKKVVPATSLPTLPRSPTTTEVARPLSLAPEILNLRARSALVNILCEAKAPLRSTSGSGVLIDPRGVILTNAHIAQHFLLEDTSVVACTIRHGSPALAQWRAKLIFIPETWIKKHAEDILNSRATGTGEHDYALLLITESLDASPLPPFSFVPLDSEEAAGVTGDPILVAGYPAEFIGGNAARSMLHASTVFSTIKQLLTFTEGVVDVVSVGGTVLAQGGSSGGGFVSFYGSLVGLIVTTSIGDTTGSRDLHAITPAHIERSLKQHTGFSVAEFLSRSGTTLVKDFAATQDTFSKLLIDAIEARRN